ncbi:type II toxin-antitoxin system RelE/ParE family toxin [Treponema denticola]|uniref:type II toxin-antitoxin system RelE/ParE family toxin n=1 Tax=Treponema denticola TaxID=158 RepID=UPI0020A36BB2|nr:type II toxin-antitoxin system RelE/ParE family toxin [Treponema denticola]UTD05025.1 type II toxin-antitoxin system RelE/ParE family toxin [Treponema denticola]
MRTIKKTEVFDTWLSKLKDEKGKAKITDRIMRLKRGNKGDHRIIDKDIYELRIHFGPDYRIYCTDKNNEIILLLIAGDKSTQPKDIKKAQQMIKLLEQGDTK